jgi:hypothetical protein
MLTILRFTELIRFHMYTNKYLYFVDKVSVCFLRPQLGLNF